MRRWGMLLLVLAGCNEAASVMNAANKPPRVPVASSPSDVDEAPEPRAQSSSKPEASPEAESTPTEPKADLEPKSEPAPSPYAPASGVDEAPEPRAQPSSKPEANPGAKSTPTEPKADVEPESEPESEPAPSPYAPALAKLTRAPVIVLDAVETPEGTFVAYRFNTLAAHLGALKPKARARAEAKIMRFEAKCTASRAKALAHLPELDRPNYDQAPPCSVQAAWSIIDRPCGKYSCIDELSPLCDALGVALLRAPDVVDAHLILTQESCLAGVEPLQREHLTGEERAEILVTATHEQWDSSHYWGWSVNTSTRSLLAFRLDSGRLKMVLELTLDENLYLEERMDSTERYTIERPGVLRLYSEAWNNIDDGINVIEIYWSVKSQRWNVKQITDNGEFPEHALPLD